MLAYLTFEITSLNDFCNAVKAGGLSLVRMFGIARLAITGGMLAGWLLGFGSSLLPPGVPPVPVAVALSLIHICNPSLQRRPRPTRTRPVAKRRRRQAVAGFR